jgi:hypothetical protein
MRGNRTTGCRLAVTTGLLLALAVVAAGPAVAKQGGTDRPVKGSGAGTAVIDLATGTATATNTAHISHLGRSTFVEHFTVTPTGPTTITDTGTATFVAANGDRLFTSFTGVGSISAVAVGATGQVTHTYTVTGGTGRFAGATGTLTAEVQTQFISLVGPTSIVSGDITLAGTISY